jgi:hypothetical protein
MVPRWVCSLFTVIDTSRRHMMGPRGPTPDMGGGGEGGWFLSYNIGRGGGRRGTVLSTDQRVHRLAMAIHFTAYVTFCHDGIFGPACSGWGCIHSPFHSSCTRTYPIDSSNPAPSIPSSAKLAREIYLRRHF